MMVDLGLSIGERKEGVARLQFPNGPNLSHGGVMMINNSSLRKWDRLSHKHLDQQFTHQMIHGLQCSPFEATAVLDTVYRVYAPYFETSGTLKPGQILFQVVSAEVSANTALAQGKQLTVVLTLDAGPEDLKVREAGGVVALRRHRLQRVCIEAFEQGGLLTVEDLANRLFNCGQRTLSRDLEALRTDAIVLPLRSTIKDMGRLISHRQIIIERWLRGKEYTEIARHTHHSVGAIQNYISKFKRVVVLIEEGYDVHTISFLVKVSASLVESYHQIYQRMPMVAHRRQELNSLLKRGPQTPSQR